MTLKTLSNISFMMIFFTLFLMGCNARSSNNEHRIEKGDFIHDFTFGPSGELLEYRVQNDIFEFEIYHQFDDQGNIISM